MSTARPVWPHVSRAAKPADPRDKELERLKKANAKLRRSAPTWPSNWWISKEKYCTCSTATKTGTDRERADCPAAGRAQGAGLSGPECPASLVLSRSESSDTYLYALRRHLLQRGLDPAILARGELDIEQAVKKGLWDDRLLDRLAQCVGFNCRLRVLPPGTSDFSLEIG